MKNRDIIKKFSAILATTAILAVFFPLKACAKEPMPVETGVITMTTTASEVEFTVAGARDIAIDWGDGRRSSVNDASLDENSGNLRFSQDFSGETARTIVITGSVERLLVNNSQLTALDVSRSPGLLELNCAGNQLTVFDVSRNTALTELHCANNRLTSLDVSRNPALKYLDCGRNQLTEIDVSRNTTLEVLEIGSNQLTSLDVSQNTALIGLGLNFNQITSLDVSKNIALRGIALVRNEFTASALDDMFRTLPDLTGIDPGDSLGSYLGTLYIIRRPSESNDPAVFECDRSIAREKGWDFRTWW